MYGKIVLISVFIFFFIKEYTRAKEYIKVYNGVLNKLKKNNWI